MRRNFRKQSGRAMRVPQGGARAEGPQWCCIECQPGDGGAPDGESRCSRYGCDHARSQCGKYVNPEFITK